MNKPKYTPGPWTVEHSGYLNQRATGPSIGVAYGAGEELYANASLIAAAPDLYEAAEAALECLESSWFGKAYVKELLRTALRKARGE